MKGSWRFPLTISLFNALAFCLTTWRITFMDAKFTSQFVYVEARTYPLGYWICLLSIPIFLLNFACLVRCRNLWAQSLVPAGTLLIFGWASLFNFLPEFPHGFLIAWIPRFALVSAIACLIHFSPVTYPYLNDSSISPDIKLDRLKESVTLWRTIVISLTFGFIGLLIPWTNIEWDLGSKILSDKKEILIYGQQSAGQLGFLTTYVFVAVILECFKKTITVADQMLNIGRHNLNSSMSNKSNSARRKKLRD
jgi:hypothetical protein